MCFVEAGLPYLTQQALALRESLLHVESDDTDLVVMGPPDVLGRFPDDVVRLEQRVVADDPEWFGYRFSNAIACLNGAHAHNLDRYSHILHTDVDTFITPSWNDFRPDGFMCGGGGYGSDAPDVAERIQAVAAELGLTHRGLVNTGATWYGPTSQVRRVGALTEMLTRHILSRHFRTDPGEWPHWYHGVALLYAAEIAINQKHTGSHLRQHHRGVKGGGGFSFLRKWAGDHNHFGWSSGPGEEQGSAQRPIGFGRLRPRTVVCDQL